MGRSGIFAGTVPAATHFLPEAARILHLSGRGGIFAGTVPAVTPFLPAAARILHISGRSGIFAGTVPVSTPSLPAMNRRINRSIPVEQNRCAMACQGCGAFLFY